MVWRLQAGASSAKICVCKAPRRRWTKKNNEGWVGPKGWQWQWWHGAVGCAHWGVWQGWENVQTKGERLCGLAVEGWAGDMRNMIAEIGKHKKCTHKPK